VAVETGLPEADIAVPAQLERLLYACGGAGEAIKFADCLCRGRNYYPEEELLQRIKDGLYVSVIGNDRLWSTIPNVYRAHGYVLGPLSALAYAGTMDHRAKTGENRHCVILSDKGALCDEDAVARSMGMDAARLRRILE
jgi:threonine synthase